MKTLLRVLVWMFPLALYGCTLDYNVEAGDTTVPTGSSGLAAGASCTLDEQCLSGACEGNDAGRSGVCR